MAFPKGLGRVAMGGKLAALGGKPDIRGPGDKLDVGKKAGKKGKPFGKKKAMPFKKPMPMGPIGIGGY